MLIISLVLWITKIQKHVKRAKNGSKNMNVKMMSYTKRKSNEERSKRAGEEETIVSATWKMQKKCII